ncbi:MAG: PQQ-like beta-propeller repeat protein [Planctomycetales bacterium]|nr:PQQ-like beta-propeller repeat protein [Planctomycetales bacterium]
MIWQHSDPVEYSIGYQASGPRAAVTIHDGKAISVGGMGRMNCLDAKTGNVIWTRDLNADYEIQMPIWGITAAPLVYQDLVIQVVSGAGDACLVAFDLSTGKERWRSLSDRGGYSAPIVIRQGQQDVVVCWTGDSVSGVDPANGKPFWSIPMKPRNMPIGVPTPVVHGNRLFVSSFYDGSMLIELDQSQPNAKKLWHRVGKDEKNTDALHAMISGPIIKGDSIYGADSHGEFRCLDLETGDRIWEDLSVVPVARWATVHTIQNGDDEIMLNDQGELLLTTLSRRGIEIRSRSKLIDPTEQQLKRRGGVVWSHPAIANGMIYARNDKELVCASLRD